MHARNSSQVSGGGGGDFGCLRLKCKASLQLGGGGGGLTWNALKCAT